MFTNLLSVGILLSIALLPVRAQNSTTASGGKASGTGGTQSFSVGQVACTPNGVISAGMQQAYIVSTVTALEEAKSIDLVVAYPNPVTNTLRLIVRSSCVYKLESLRYHVYDSNGKMMQSGNFSKNDSQIDMSSLKPETYFVRVFHGEKELRSFKIIKN